MIIIQLLKDTKKSAKHQTVIDNSLDNYAIAKDFFSALGFGRVGGDTSGVAASLTASVRLALAGADQTKAG